MKTRSSRIVGSCVLAVAAGVFAAQVASAKGGRGGHAHARAPHAPHVSAPHHSNMPRAPKPPKMPHAASPGRAKNPQGHAARNSQTNTSRSQRTNSAATSRATTTNVSPNNPSSFAYSRGTGSGARRYQMYGYGRGYRNRYYGGRSGYGRSQGNNRAIVARLRSVHQGLARVDHDYQGHRVRAMHAVSMAIRQLSHRSMVYRGMGFAPGMNNQNAMGMRQRGGAGGRGGGQRMTQAQSDSQMNQAGRILQGIGMQLTTQGYHSAGHARARGHVQHATQEIGIALSIR